MIYHMSTSTFIRDFITNVDTDDVLDYQYVIISNGVKASKTRNGSVIKMNDLLPSNRVCAEYLNSMNEEEFFTNYYNDLQDIGSKVMMSMLIKESIEQGDVIIIYGPTDCKVPYMNVLEDFFENEFHYPICDFKKYLNGKIEIETVDDKKVLKKVNALIEKSKRRALDPTISTVNQRREYVSQMGKKELRKLLKDYGVPSKGLGKPEMKDILYTMFDSYIDE